MLLVNDLQTETKILENVFQFVIPNQHQHNLIKISFKFVSFEILCIE